MYSYNTQAVDPMAYSTPESEAMGTASIFLIWGVIMVCAPFHTSWPFIAWFVGGLATVMLRCSGATKENDSSFWEEIGYGLNAGRHNLFTTIMFWPLDLLFLLFRGEFSYKRDFLSARANEIKELPTSFGMHWETAHAWAGRDANYIARQGERIGETFEAVPDFALATARCGIAATTLSASVVHGADADTNTVATSLVEVQAGNPVPKVEAPIHGSLAMFGFDHYLAPRVNRALTETPVFQTTLHLDAAHGVWFEAFGSYGFSAKPTESFGNEIDAAVGKIWKVGAYTVNTSFRWLNEPPLDEAGNEDIAVWTASGSREFHLAHRQMLRPELMAEWMAHPEMLDRGAAVLRAGVAYNCSEPLGIPHVGFFAKETVVWDSGWAKNNPHGVFFQIDSGLEISAGKHIKFTVPGVRFIQPIQNGQDGRGTDAAVYGGMRVVF